MSKVHLRKYGAETKIPFELFEVDGIDFRTDASHVSGDTKIQKDEEAEANTTNGFVDEGQGYSIKLTVAEMQAARIVVYIVDSATKAWLDRTLIIETYGAPQAQICADLDKENFQYHTYPEVSSLINPYNGIEFDIVDQSTEDRTAAANMEIVFDTDFGTNYNTTRNAWATNLQDQVGTGNLTVDVIAISGDTTSADNLELQYDTNGLTGDTFPATQAQLGGIANVGSAVHRPASSYTLTTGTQSANTVSSTEALDGTRHEHTDDTGVLSLEYHHLIGSGTASSVKITGYMTGNNDDVDVKGYDWVTAGYKQIGNIQGTASTTNQVFSFDLFVDMTGKGANLGKVDIQLIKSSGLSTALLAIDQIFIAFSQGAGGYDGGNVWYDDSVSNTNTVPEVDGVVGNEVSTEAAVETLLTSTKLHKVNVAPGSTYALASAHTNRIITGHGATCALGTQNVDESHFVGFNAVSGVATAATSMDMHDCIIGTASNQKCNYFDCSFTGTVTWTLAGDYRLVRCQSGVAGAGSPTFAKTAGQAITAEFRWWSGGITFSGLEVGDTLTVSGELGTVDLGSPAGAVAIEVRGTYKSITNIGSAAVNLDGAIQAADVAAILVDTNELQSDDVPGLIAALENISAADVNAQCDTALSDYDGPTNAEMEARTPTAAQLAYIVANSATGMPVVFTTAGGSTTVAVIDTIDGGAGSAVDDQYNGRLLVFTSGTLKGCVTDITDYDGGTTTATITAIPTAPLSSHAARLI